MDNPWCPRHTLPPPPSQPDFLCSFFSGTAPRVQRPSVRQKKVYCTPTKKGLFTHLGDYIREGDVVMCIGLCSADCRGRGRRRVIFVLLGGQMQKTRTGQKVEKAKEHARKPKPKPRTDPKPHPRPGSSNCSSTTSNCTAATVFAAVVTAAVMSRATLPPNLNLTRNIILGTHISRPTSLTLSCQPPLRS